MKKVFIFFIFSFLQLTQAQQIPAEYQLSPAGLLETNFDHYGTSYPLANLQIGATTNYTVVQAGIFDIYYAANSGMEGTSTANSQKRNVINKVFSDLSDFLDTPLKTIPNAPKIKIWIQNFTAVQSHAYNDIAYGTSFYNVPKNMGTAAIADNQLWQMINSGKDPYHKVTFSVDDSNQPLSFFHAAFAFNPALNWNTSLGYAPYANQYDLYTFALREAVHALGVNSLIAQNGTSRFGANYNYYSRFDTFLKNKNNVALIANTQGCSFNSGYGFNANLSDLGTNCNNNDNASPCGKTNYFAGTNTLKLVTPNCYNPLVTSLFVNTNCNENLDNNWLLDRALRKGDMQRYLNPYERRLLVDLGYGFARTFGKNSRLNHINYNRPATSHAVVGVNDGFDSLGNTLYTTVNQPLPLPNLLVNDKNATNFECLQDLTDATAIFSATTGTASTSATFTTTIKGNHLLSYIPYNASTGKRGNRTYVYVYALKADCPVDPDPCNLVLNGGFEVFNVFPPGRDNLSSTVCRWEQNQSVDHYHRSILDGTSGIPDNFTGTQETITNPFINNGGSNDAYAGIGNTWQSIYIAPNTFELHRYREIVSGTLLPLTQNTIYELTIDVSLAEFNQNRQSEIQVLLTDSNTPRITTAYDDIDSNTIPGSRLLHSDLQPQLISDTNNWTTLHFTFNSESDNFRHLHIGSLFNAAESNHDIGVINTSYYYIDNVVLREVNRLPVLDLQPESLCVTEPSLDLSTMLTGGTTSGVFSGPGVTGTTFNPATAGVGTHTITYTIPNPNSCLAIVVTDTITVNSCLPAQPPYISQVYAYTTQNQFIESKFVEVKNKDNTTAIPPGQYFLALYANGAPTTGAPTSFIDLGAIPANGVALFRSGAITPPSAYAAALATTYSGLQQFNGQEDILIITTRNDENAYANRIDELGDTTTHSVFRKDYTQEDYRSLVRVSCMPLNRQPPQISYDEQDWVGFNRVGLGATGPYDDSFEIAQGTKTNGELGRHWSEDLTWNGAWNDISPDGSNPDRSRTVLINQPYNTSNPNTGSFEACSLVSNAFLTINPLTFTKVETEVSSTVPNGIMVENTGSLIQVRDTYYGVANQNLIHIAAQGSIKHARETIAINSGTDYVYWSSPLSLNPLNKKAGQLFNFGTAPSQFNPSRFFRFENQNFYDAIINPIWGQDNGSGTDGYDDDAGYNQNPATIDYLPFSQIPSAINEHFIPGRGYVTWPPVGSATDYTITFEGEMNNGLVEVPVYRNDSQFGTDSNLIGNPYPSPIDLDKFFDDPVNTDLIKPVAFIWGRSLFDIPLTTNPGPDLLNFTEDNFKIYNPDMVIDPTQLPFLTNLFINSGILASCQSFFVLAKDPVSNTIDVNTGLIETLGNIRFSNYMRTKELNDTFNLVDPRGANNQTARTVASTTAADKLWLNLSDTTNYTAQLGIIFKENGLPTYSQNEDVETIQGRKYNFYTQTSTAKDLIIDVQDNFNVDKEIPLGILNIRGEHQIFTISIPRKEGVFNNQEVYLVDSLTGVQHNLSQSNYTFTTSQVITEGRFKLVFTTNYSNTTNKTDSANNLLCSFNENGLYLHSNNQNIKDVEVYDLQVIKSTGYLVKKQKDINNNTTQIPVANNHKLITVKITLQDGSQVVKKLAR